MTDNITLPREVVEEALDALTGADDFSPGGTPIYMQEITALRTALAAEQPKQEQVPSDDRKAMKEALRILTKPEPERRLRWQVSDARDILRTAIRTAPPDAEALRRDAELGRWLRDWLDNNGLLVRAIRGESLAGYEHPDIKALRRDAERLWEALKHYGKHDDDCGDHDAYNSESLRHCGCGLDAVLDETLGEKR